MVIVANGWKRCSRCGVVKPNGQFWAKTRDASGWPATRQSACKVCIRQRNRKLKGYKARRKIVRTDEERKAMQRASRRAYAERIKADPEALAAARAKRRMDARVARDRKRGAPPREYKRRPREVKADHAYVGPSNADTVAAEPFRTFLAVHFPGWDSRDLAALLGNAVSDRWIWRLFAEQPERLELDAVDRVLTRGLGRPDLLNAIYPMP